MPIRREVKWGGCSGGGRSRMSGSVLICLFFLFCIVVTGWATYVKTGRQWVESMRSVVNVAESAPKLSPVNIQIIHYSIDKQLRSLNLSFPNLSWANTNTYRLNRNSRNQNDFFIEFGSSIYRKYRLNWHLLTFRHVVTSRPDGYDASGSFSIVPKYGKYPKEFDITLIFGRKIRNVLDISNYPCALSITTSFYTYLHRLGGLRAFLSLLSNSQKGQQNNPSCYAVRPSKESIPTWRVPLGFICVIWGMLIMRFYGDSCIGWWCALLFGVIGVTLILNGYIDCETGDHSEYRQIFPHNCKSVTQKYLTRLYYCNTVIDMANVLNTDKQIAVIGALAEGSSIRSIERITGVHRDTIMRLGVRVGQGCATLLDAKMRDLSCNRLEMDEIWGFIGKKARHVRPDDDPQLGDVWTFCAVDAETKLVPAFKVGKRDVATANAFVRDIASRMRNRVQISTDGLRAYVEAVEKAFGADVDYAQIVKTYGHEEVSDNRRYSAPDFVSSEKKVIVGNPDERLISTSYVERLNATTRLHMRRLTRLTLAFSKKLENFEAAVALHFAYYNFVKRHNTLRCTPAMAAGVENDFLTVGDLVEVAA